MCIASMYVENRAKFVHQLESNCAYTLVVVCYTAMICSFQPRYNYIMGTHTAVSVDFSFSTSASVLRFLVRINDTTANTRNTVLIYGESITDNQTDTYILLF